jgi:EAL domain-containing protein (putative c-di-GMP-specific phosphodiesterase class I)
VSLADGWARVDHLLALARTTLPPAQAEQLSTLLADMIGDHVTGTLVRKSKAADAVREVLRDGSVRAVFQPVVRLDDDRIVGYESLARFDFATPDEAFASAAEAGLGVPLETLAMRRALERLDDLPPDTTLGINLSVEALMTPAVVDEVIRHAAGRICVELTEHSQVPDYAALLVVTERLRAAGVLLVVDDAGAGYASLSHILQLRPDVIKLDISLTRDIDSDPVRAALARSLMGFAIEVGARIVAEGVETKGEYDKLRAIGVHFAQGYYLAKPGPLPGTAFL